MSINYGLSDSPRFLLRLFFMTLHAAFIKIYFTKSKNLGHWEWYEIEREREVWKAKNEFVG